MVTSNSLETMIEHKLISNIFNRICEKFKTWGTKWKRQIDKTTEWVAWRCANAKIDKKSLTLLKAIVNILKEDMEDYH